MLLTIIGFIVLTLLFAGALMYAGMLYLASIGGFLPRFLFLIPLTFAVGVFCVLIIAVPTVIAAIRALL